METQLTVHDLLACVNFIDVCSRRGAVQGNEMEAVGTLRGKLTRVVDAFKAAEAVVADTSKDAEAVVADTSKDAEAVVADAEGGDLSRGSAKGAAYIDTTEKQADSSRATGKRGKPRAARKD